MCDLKHTVSKEILVIESIDYTNVFCFVFSNTTDNKNICMIPNYFMSHRVFKNRAIKCFHIM